MMNKIKRAEVYAKQKLAKGKAKSEKRKRQREEEAGDEDGGAARKAARPQPKTTESMRLKDDTIATDGDDEVIRDEAEDEFATIWSGEELPKVMITTQRFPSARAFPLIAEFLRMLPRAFYYKRGHFELKKICEYASEKKFTHLMVVTERLKRPNGLIIVKLPLGPTAVFKLRSAVKASDIKGHGAPTPHACELILNNFATRLGRRVGRVLGSLFQHNPDFTGRQVATFHNQRDFIFFRMHRYIFEGGDEIDDGNEGETGKMKKKPAKKATKPVRVRMQELGPRFTLKLKYLLAGTFDTSFGEYEFIRRKAVADLSRHRFDL
jgi:ribosome production factor 1